MWPKINDVVDPVPRAKVDLQLVDTTGEDAMLAWISIDKTVNTDLDTCATRTCIPWDTNVKSCD